eukprot:219413-Prorocentrum_lima.AAC.1
MISISAEDHDFNVSNVADVWNLRSTKSTATKSKSGSLQATQGHHPAQLQWSLQQQQHYVA